MTLLTVTSRGQVTFRQEVLKHLGVKPGEKIELDLLPYGRAELKSVQQKDTFRALHGFLKGKTSGKRLTIDENVLLRAVVGDDARQSRLAIQAMERAELVAISVHVLCELAWVLNRQYEVSRPDIAATICQLLNTKNVALNRPAAEAGLTMLESGGDFADGVIAYEGGWLGGEMFVSFDKKAVSLLAAQNQSARLL